MPALNDAVRSAGSRIHGIAQKVRRILVREYRTPSRPSSRLAFTIRIFFKCLIVRCWKRPRNNIPLVVYDLDKNVISYDFLSVLYLCEVECRRLGCEHFDLVLYMEKDRITPTAMGAAYENIITARKIEDRVRDLIIPIAEHYLACTSVKIVTTYGDLANTLVDRVHIVPHGYDGINRPILHQHGLYRYISQGLPFQGIAAKQEDRDRCAEWIRQNSPHDRIVTFTMRDYGWQPSRNLLLSDISFALDSLKRCGVQPVLIPDLDGNMDVHASDNFIIYRAASKDLGLRLAINERALVNVVSPSGPMMAVIFNQNSRGICVKTFHDSPNEETGHGTRIYKQLFRIEIGSQPLLPAAVLMIWERDFVGALTAAIEDAVARRRN